MRPRTRRLAVAAALMLAGGSLWWSQRPVAGVAGEGASPKPSGADAAPATAGVAWLEGVGVPEGPARHPAPSPPKSDDVEQEIPFAPADGPVRLVLRLVGDGPRPDEIGVVVHARRPGFPVRLLLSDGVVEGRLPAAETYDQILVTLDGWPSDERFEQVAVPDTDTRVVTLDVTLPGAAFLVVVDATTGAPLPGARAMHCEGPLDSLAELAAPPRRTSRHHVPITPILADAAGRILLSHGSATLDWWVGAPDHAWVRRRVPGGAGTVRVALEPGGGILAEIEGWEEIRERSPRVVATRPRPRAVGEVSGHPPGARDTYERTRDVDLAPSEVAGTFVLEGLPPGHWKVVVGSSAQVFLGEVWGEAPVDVRAGQLTRVRVSARAPLDPGRVTLDLAVSVPDECGDTLCIGVLRRLGAPDGELPRWLAFSEPTSSRQRIEGLLPGTYQFLGPFGWACVIRVAPETPLVRVTVPPLTSLRVRVLDAVGDGAVPDATVVVRYADPSEGPSTRDETSDADPGREDLPEFPRGYMRLDRAPGSEDFVGRVASGAVWIDALAQGRVGSSARRTLAPGDGETLVELRLPRAGRVSVRVLRGSALAKDATGSILCAAQASVADEDWSARSVVLQAGVALFDRVRPGPYAISWSSGHGEPAVAREIVVRAGETVTVDLPTK